MLDFHTILFWTLQPDPDPLIWYIESVCYARYCLNFKKVKIKINSTKFMMKQIKNLRIIFSEDNYQESCHIIKNS